MGFLICMSAIVLPFIIYFGIDKIMNDIKTEEFQDKDKECYQFLKNLASKGWSAELKSSPDAIYIKIKKPEKLSIVLNYQERGTNLYISMYTPKGTEHLYSFEYRYFPEGIESVKSIEYVEDHFNIVDNYPEVIKTKEQYKKEVLDRWAS